VAVIWAAVEWCERRPGTSLMAAGAAVRVAGTTSGGWRAAWRDPVGVSRPSALLGRLAAQRQGPQPSERAGEFDGPWPGGLQPQDEAAGMADDAGGDVQQPVAQRLGFGAGQRAGKEQRLGPAAKVLGGQDQLEPDGVAAPAVERQVGQAGGLGGADAVLDPGALPVAQLQPGQVRVGLVGEEDLEAVAVVVGEAQLGAGVGVLSSADRPGARRPGVQVDPAGQLAGLGAVASLAVGLHRGRPGVLGLGEDRLADVGVDLHPQGEPDAALA
jgi:hypothetical protein